jgi:hypothetical protein
MTDGPRATHEEVEAVKKRGMTWIEDRTFHVAAWQAINY